ncbi:hypothetical protein, partial [[Eubacterium] cellulosolvens]
RALPKLREVDYKMNKKIILGTAILAILLSGAIAGLSPLTFGFSQSNQQISEAQYYPMHYGPRWRSYPYPYGTLQRI